MIKREMLAVALLMPHLPSLMYGGPKAKDYHSTSTIFVTPVKIPDVALRSVESVENVFETIIHAYSMYMYHPRVIEAFSRGDSELKNVPLKIGSDVKKLTFTYSEILVNFVKSCTESGGEVRVGYLPLLQIPKAQIEGKYVDVIEHRKEGKFVRKYPVYVCLKG
ncbi:MAG: hypothetical protein Q9N34_09185, partial [Aquificota bacterium]|nr:hypothetical protein [Aquificota bacterium]